MHFERSWMAVLTLVCLAWAASASTTRAAPQSFTVPLSGGQQVPPVTTPGEGTASLSYDPSTRLLSWTITYTGLSSSVTMAHFHGPAPAGKNGDVQIWISKRGEPATSPIKGQAKLDPSQAKQLMAGDWYINVHTEDHPPGEVRGQVVPPKP